ncbi:heterokaryon incompatibility protein-domain-containing protein [Cercophora newfieldiana]|uniref:Heterokaryon incompatibility protein-domain-containing protein n=1 Tax=Cercophora newfieldiana TaxID=92897 RepID=A0AA39Y6N3_9PEZI|nr:heterokaryon incompatibility protein-domain-containing protein [Cercophora newfieldiana]
MLAPRRLRYPDRERHLWIDALGINQADNAEKSHQVNMMGEIYSSAQQRLLWLGEFKEETSPPRLDSDPKSDFTSTIARSAAETIVQMLADGSHLTACFEAPKSTDMAINPSDTLKLFLDLSWWTRIWTVQEAVLPRQTLLICGLHQLHFSVFSSAFANIIKHFSAACCALLSHESTVLQQFFLQVTTFTNTGSNATPLTSSTPFDIDSHPTPETKSLGC